MKRTLVAAVLVVVLVLGVVAYASALGQSGNVSVSAVVNPKISLTVAADAASADWSAINPGVAVGTKIYNFTVQSNKQWQFTNDSVTYTPNDGLLDAILSEAYAGDFVPTDTVAKGSYTANVTLTLDTVGAGVYDLDPTVGTYTADYLYTATQL